MKFKGLKIITRNGEKISISQGELFNSDDNIYLEIYISSSTNNELYLEIFKSQIKKLTFKSLY